MAAKGDGEAFSAEEKAAMKETAAERRRSKKANAVAEEAAALAEKIAEMPPEDRALAEKIHGIVASVAPELAPSTWYGMPAWKRGGKVICFFQSKAKFKVRYSTFGFDQRAALDDGDMWPVSFALLEIGPDEEARIAELVRRAVAD